jgi:branched-chain amino acid transport system substrate-binding protein
MAHVAPRWSWVLAILPALALSACGGSRLTHDAIVAAVNGEPSPAAVAPQQQAGTGTVSTLPQISAVPRVPGGSGTVTGSGSGAARSTPAGGGPAAPAGAVTAGGPTAPRPEGPLAPIVLGNVGTYSGPAGSSTAGTDTMVQVWAQWTNAHGGIAGHPVQVFTADDGGDPQRSLALLKDMVENRHVIAFLANQVPFTMQAQLPYLHQHGIPLIGGDNTQPLWTADSLAFPLGTTIAEAVLGDYKEAHRRNLPRLGLFYCIEAPACTFIHDYTVNGGASRAGEDLVYQSQISLTQPDFTAQCLGAQSAGAQVVFLAMEANSIIRVAASCSRQNYHPLYVATAAQTTRDLEGYSTLEGFFATSQDFPYMIGNTPATARFQQAVQQYAPNLRLSGATTIAWASGQMLARVAAARVGAQPASQDLLNGLWTVHNETLDGLTPPITYTRNQPAPPVECYFLIELRGGRWASSSGDTYAC